MIDARIPRTSTITNAVTAPLRTPSHDCACAHLHAQNHTTHAYEYVFLHEHKHPTLRAQLHVHNRAHAYKFTHAVARMRQTSRAHSRACARTWTRDILDGDVKVVRHEAEHGEDDEPGEERRAAVRDGEQDAVPARRKGRGQLPVTSAPGGSRIWSRVRFRWWARLPLLEI